MLRRPEIAKTHEESKKVDVLKIREYRAYLVYSPSQNDDEQRVFFDPSCSKFDLKAEEVTPINKTQTQSRHQSWMIVGCKSDVTLAEGSLSSNLQLHIFWQRSSARDQDAKAQGGAIWPVFIDGQEIDPESNKPYEPFILKLKPQNKKDANQPNVTVSSGDQKDTSAEKLTLLYRLPPSYHRGSVGFGIGPYQFDFEGGGQNIHRTVALPTAYISYQATDFVRVVAFEATPLAKPWTTDLGVYLVSESTKFFDRRFSFNIMLGAHVLGFQARNDYKLILGAPQGFELIGTDILKRGYNLALGGFIFPSISGKAYNNIWVRYGTKKFFGEFNYILWRESADQESYFSRSVGVTLGMPLPFLNFL